MKIELLLVFACLALPFCQARSRHRRVENDQGAPYWRQLEEYLHENDQGSPSELDAPNTFGSGLDAPSGSRSELDAPLSRVARDVPVTGLDNAICSRARSFMPFSRDTHCPQTGARVQGCRFYRHLPAVIQSYINRADDVINGLMAKVSMFRDPAVFTDEAARLGFNPCRSSIKKLQTFSRNIGSAMADIIPDTDKFDSFMSLWNEVLTCHHGCLENAVLNARCNWDSTQVTRSISYLVPSTKDLLCRLHLSAPATSAMQEPQEYQPPETQYQRFMHNHIIYTSYKQSLFRLQAVVLDALDTGLC